MSGNLSLGANGKNYWRGENQSKGCCTNATKKQKNKKNENFFYNTYLAKEYTNTHNTIVLVSAGIAQSV